MCRWVYLWVDFGYLPLSINEIRDTVSPPDFFAVHLFHDKGTVLVHHRHGRIRQECKRQRVLFDKFLVGLWRVFTDTKDLNLHPLEVLVYVGNHACLLGTPGSIILGVEIDDGPLPYEFFVGVGDIVLVNKCKRGCFFADF